MEANESYFGGKERSKHSNKELRATLAVVGSLSEMRRVERALRPNPVPTAAKRGIPRPSA